MVSAIGRQLGPSVLGELVRWDAIGQVNSLGLNLKRIH